VAVQLLEISLSQLGGTLLALPVIVGLIVGSGTFDAMFSRAQPLKCCSGYILYLRRVLPSILGLCRLMMMAS